MAGREVNFKVAMTFMLKAGPQSSPLLKMKEIFDIDALNNAVNLAPLSLWNQISTGAHI